MPPDLKAKSDAAFEQAWHADWQAKVEGNFFSRRWEPTIKQAAKAVWDHCAAWFWSLPPDERGAA